MGDAIGACETSKSFLGESFRYGEVGKVAETAECWVREGYTVVGVGDGRPSASWGVEESEVDLGEKDLFAFCLVSCVHRSLRELAPTEECQSVVETSPALIETLVCDGKPFYLFREHLVSPSP